MDKDDQGVLEAADQLSNTITKTLDDLTDELLERPAYGSAEWHTEQQAWHNRETWAIARIQERHLTKIAIATQANLDPSGDVLYARQIGVTWQAIADKCNITWQTAYERWGKHVAAGAGMDA